MTEHIHKNTIYNFVTFLTNVTKKLHFNYHEITKVTILFFFKEKILVNFKFLDYYKN